MADNKVGRILLVGKGSARFFSSLIKPSKNDVAQHDRQMDKINNNISLRYDDINFEAIIKDLDLSFVDTKQGHPAKSKP